MTQLSEPLAVSRQEFEDLRKSVRRLEDIRAIETLKYRYFRCVDTANFAELRELLHEDLTTDIKGGDFHVTTSGAENFLAFLGDAMHSRIVALHQGHHPEIELLSETEAAGRWYLWDDFWDLDAKTRLYGSALYEDRYIKVEGRWLFLHTGYYRVFEALENMPNPPRLAVHMLSETGRRHEGAAPKLEGQY